MYFAMSNMVLTMKIDFAKLSLNKSWLYTDENVILIRIQNDDGQILIEKEITKIDMASVEGSLKFRKKLELKSPFLDYLRGNNKITLISRCLCWKDWTVGLKIKHITLFMEYLKP
eukprot:UN13401